MKATLLSILFAGTLVAAPKVSLVNLPMHAKQPQVVTDAKGVAHIVFLSGKERATDVYYVTRSSGKFSKPMKVNQIAGSAVAVGTDDSETRAFLARRFQFASLTTEIAEKTITLRRRHRKLRLPDAIIWATTMAHDCVLVTRNTRDFSAKEKSVRVPYKI